MNRDRVLGDAQTIGNLRVAQPFELMEDEHLAATWRQVGERRVQRLKLLPRDQHGVWQRRWIDDIFVQFNSVADCVPTPLTRVIDRQIPGGSEEIAPQVTHVIAGGTEQTQKRLLDEIGGGCPGHALPHQEALKLPLFIRIKRRQIGRQVAHKRNTGG